MKKMMIFIVAMLTILSIGISAPADTAKGIIGVTGTTAIAPTTTATNPITPSNIDTAKDWKQEILQNITGNTLDWADYVTCFFFAFLGLLIRTGIRTKSGIKNNKNGTPEKFNWIYWIRDNVLTKLSSMMFIFVVIFVTLRFSMDWFGQYPSMAFSFVVGLGIDYFIEFLKKIQPKLSILKPSQPAQNSDTDSTAPTV